MLQVKLFGPGQVQYNSSRVVHFPHQQACLVFCYLLLSPNHPFHRDQLAAVFWGDSPAQTARKNLRNALWKLRQFLETAGIPPDIYLRVDEESIAFVNASPYWLDTHVFDATIAQFQDRAGEMLSREQAALLEKAVDLYTGDFLEGVYEDWCLYERERLSLVYLNTLGKLMTYHEKSGQYERGLMYGERILIRDNTREKVHVQMMRLHWRLGDRQAALAQYQRCAQILREELNIQPVPETTLVYQQMLHNQFDLAFVPESESGTAVQPAIASIPERILARLSRLQSVVEQTQAEIHQIEALMSQLAGNSNR